MISFVERVRSSRLSDFFSSKKNAPIQLETESREPIEFEATWLQIQSLSIQHGLNPNHLERREYRAIVEKVISFLNNPHSEPTPIIITGKAGLGKTTFLKILSLALPRATQFFSSFEDTIVRFHQTGEKDSNERVMPFDSLSNPLSNNAEIKTLVVRLEAWLRLQEFFMYNPHTYTPFDQEAARWLNEKLRGRVLLLDEMDINNGASLLSWSEVGTLVIVTSNQDNVSYLPNGSVNYVEVTGSDLRIGSLKSASLSQTELESSGRYEARQQLSNTAPKFISRFLKDRQTQRLVAVIDFLDAMRMPFSTGNWQDFFHSGADALIIENFTFLNLPENIEYDASFLDLLQKFVQFMDAVDLSRVPVQILIPKQKKVDALEKALQSVLDTLENISPTMPGLRGDLPRQFERAVSRLRAAGGRV